MHTTKLGTNIDWIGNRQLFDSPFRLHDVVFDGGRRGAYLVYANLMYRVLLHASFVHVRTTVCKTNECFNNMGETRLRVFRYFSVVESCNSSGLRLFSNTDFPKITTGLCICELKKFKNNHDTDIVGQFLRKISP